MKRSLTLTFALAALGLVLAGCKPEESTKSGGTTTSSGTGSGTSTSSPSPDADRGTTGTGTTAATPEPAPPTPEVKPPDADSNTTTPDNPPPPTDSNTTSDASAPQADDDPLVQGISNGRLVDAYLASKSAAAEQPTDVMSQLNLISILQSVGQTQLQMDAADKAYAAFAKAGETARALLETKPELPDGASRLLGRALYNEACAFGRANDVENAVVSLEAAIAQGFSDFDLLQNDEDLVSVRSDAGFAAKLESWQKAAAEAAKQHAIEELARGETFPFDFALTSVDGKDLKLADYRGKVLIVDIWGTWCPPCRAEIPSFIKLQETYGEQGFQIIGLNYEGSNGEEAAETVRSFIADNGMNYPCALGDEATQKQVPDFRGYPTTLFIDKTGKVRLKVVGLHEYAFLEGIVQALLEEPAPEAGG
jgi:thiol-disulfide isomerase/thioredoxin